MSASSQQHVTIVWLSLVLATCATWWLSTSHPFSATSEHLASSIAIAIAFIKVYYIGMDFMELRGAPRVLRRIFMAWIGLTGGAAIALYAI
ncbi:MULTISPECIES: cytochrome C oxidase subunit IV family protein [Pseudomonas]|uniref:Prokaryotic cytochrome C oxidase subunit IV family protein n=1 Tax=Pseudomonas fluorescens TaxID=294 RepID=A0A159ZWH3_PSEFL|nr:MULTISPECIES: cytochrome C oxidase subunit IV family protein [Pseudomonas]AMZ71289.1 hypothetical protein TK06_09310 [Pseudomonas fluorescens]